MSITLAALPIAVQLVSTSSASAGATGGKRQCYADGMIGAKSRWEEGTFWIPTVLGLLGAVTGIYGCMNSKRVSDVQLEPRLFFSKPSFAPSHSAEVSSVLNFELQNRGGVTVTDVSAWGAYKTNSSWMSEDGMEHNILTPGDTLDMNMHLFEPGIAGPNARIPKVHPDLVKAGKEPLSVQLRAAGYVGKQEVVICEEFSYDPSTATFRRREDCKLWDGKPIP